MSKKNYFWVAFMALSLLEVGQMAFSQDHPVAYNQHKFAVSEQLRPNQQQDASVNVSEFTDDDCRLSMASDFLVTRMGQKFAAQPGKTLLSHVWLPAYLQ